MRRVSHLSTKQPSRHVMPCHAYLHAVSCDHWYQHHSFHALLDLKRATVSLQELALGMHKIKKNDDKFFMVLYFHPANEKATKEKNRITDT